MAENLLDLKYVNRDGDTMRGPLKLAGDVREDSDAATKRYVDTVLANLGVQLVRRDGSLPMTGPLSLSGAPTANQHAATKAYAEAVAAVASAVMVRLDGTLPMTGLLTLSGAPTNVLHATTRGYVDALAAALAAVMVRHDGTVPMTGDLTLAGAPTNALHATTRAYVLALDVLNVRLDGTRPMTGALRLPGLPVNPLEAATKGYVDALPVGLSTYDAVVAAAGGDYTSIVTACATEAVGARIFVKSGTYNETANIVMQDGQMLIGENPEDTIIEFGAANRKITFAGGPTNLIVRDLTIQGSRADYTVDLSGNYATIHNCRILGTINAFMGVRFAGANCILSNNYISGFTRAGLFYDVSLGNYNKAFGNTFDNCERGMLAGNDCHIVNNLFLNCANSEALIGQGSIVVGNNFLSAVAGIRVGGSECTFSGNYIFGTAGIRWEADHDYITIAGNSFEDSRVWCNVAGVSDCTITGNIFKNGTGVYFEGNNSVISGNILAGTAFISLPAASKDNCITGNNLQSSTNVPKIVDAGTANAARNNHGECCLMRKSFSRMKNTSGGGLVEGDVVVYKTVAAGDEVDTTVVIGDDYVYGMVEDATLANNAYGNIQTEGFTAKLKVNGTVAILVGDLLSCNNVAGIARKAAGGHVAFAIALEAYAGADNLGVINANLCRNLRM